MKKISMLLMLCAAFAAICDDTTESQSEDTIIFEYEILPSEMGESDFQIHGDTISFELRYVDVDCEGNYEYVFEKKKRELIIKRALLPDGKCKTGEDLLYAFKGMLRGIPRGIYRFSLKAQNNRRTEIIFSEPIQLK
jgi:hypothetical protein